MNRYGWKSVFKSRQRLLANVVVIGCCLMIILVVDGFRQGIRHQATSYYKNTVANIYLSKSGTGLVGSSSYLPSSIKALIEKEKDVQKISQIIITPTILDYNGDHPITLIGFQHRQSGGPWSIVEGRNIKSEKEIVFDQALAKLKDLKIGQRVRLFNKKLTIVGLSAGTDSFLSPISFVSLKKLRDISKMPGRTSYFLIQTSNLRKTKANLKKINNTVVRTPNQLAERDKTKISNAIGPILNVLIVISVLVAFLVTGLTLLITTISRYQEYATLKAIGCGNVKMFLLILKQSLLYSLLGLVFSYLIAQAVAQIIHYFFPKTLIYVNSTTTSGVFALTVIISILASAVPMRKVAKIDPVLAFGD